MLDILNSLHFVVHKVKKTEDNPALPGRCTGLKTEWTSTITATTEFPVDPATVVDVTCSDSDHVNTGSSQVTCAYYTEFSYESEPNCGIPGTSYTAICLGNK